MELAINRGLVYAALFLCICCYRTASAQTPTYPWAAKVESSNAVVNRIAAPPGFARVTAESSTFGDWLRHLPLKDGRPPVMLYSGESKRNQEAHFAVVNMDIGHENLLQCADAVIRLRAEYLYSTRQFDRIRFNFTNGDTASFRKWINGYRPVIIGNKSRWVKSASVDSSYTAFREYLDCVFTYAGTVSLSRELVKVDDSQDIGIGDVWIRGGKPGTKNPGHAVIVLDVAHDTLSGEPIFMLAQSYMPAQEIHVLKNPNGPELDPWYRLPDGEILHTPEWDFKIDELKRFR